MLRDTETEKKLEASTVAQQPPRKKWTCKLGGCIFRNADGQYVEWSYEAKDWCHPVEYKGS